MTNTSTPVRYLAITAVVVVVFHLAIGFLNYLVDPLWFFGGNKVQPRNFPFDERAARLAHFVTSDRDHDCYIFGASRVAMLNPKRIEGYDCFMVSFANATPRELLAYAAYMNERAQRKPELVIVGVDDFSFFVQADALDVPAAIHDDREPFFFEYYLSANVTYWSLQTLFDIAPKPRYFGADLEGLIRSDAKYLPVLQLDLEPSEYQMSLASVHEYAKFRELYPEARIVAYATPVTADQIVEYRDSGVLPVYLEALHAASREFDAMYDFSIPSEFTIDPDLTYDGSHYEPHVSDRIASAILHHQPEFGIVLSGLTVEQIAAHYATRLATLLPHDEPRHEHGEGSGDNHAAELGVVGTPR